MASALTLFRSTFLASVPVSDSDVSLAGTTAYNKTTYYKFSYFKAN